MFNKFFTTFIPLLFIISMVGCAVSPTYINDEKLPEDKMDSTQLNPVHYKLEGNFIASPPQCIAIMPLIQNIKKGNANSPNISEESLEQLRWSLYSQLAPYTYRDVELASVTKALLSVGDAQNYAAIANELSCDALLLTEVTDYYSGFFGIYSNTSIGVKMKLIRAESVEVLWEGNHVAKSHGGTIPLSPVGLIVGLYSATENLSEEQLVRVKDDVFRRLLSTWSVDGIPIKTTGDNTEQSELAKLEVEQSIEEELHYSFVSVHSLWLRTGPGRTFPQKSVLYQEDKLEIINNSYLPWVQVRIADGRQGYVNSKYIITSSVKSSN